MRLALIYTRATTLELLRMPSFCIPTIAYPALVFLLFGLPNAGGKANLLLASYAAFAVLGVGFFQFGVGFAIERTTPWQRFLRALPARATPRIAGRLVTATFFAASTTLGVVLVVLATTPADLSANQWARLTLTLAAGGIPFVLLGVALAYWCTPKGALPIANALYLVLAYAGGLWTGPSGIPSSIRVISTYTPTRQWADILWSVAADKPWRAEHWLILTGYAIAFALLASWGFQRDEGQQFR
jgi:ABC-2 type transport system permease protein